jgi:hypothetical protein
MALYRIIVALTSGIIVYASFNAALDLSGPHRSGLGFGGDAAEAKPGLVIIAILLGLVAIILIILATYGWNKIKQNWIKVSLLPIGIVGITIYGSFLLFQ